jgi:GAF domain-containing protein
MPILDGQKCLGVIQCINKFNGYFTKDDEGLLAMISDFAKIVLKNALQFDE